MALSYKELFVWKFIFLSIRFLKQVGNNLTSPIYLHLIFAILQFEISSLMNLIFSLFQTWILQTKLCFETKMTKLEVGHFIRFLDISFANWIISFHKTEVPTVILKGPLCQNLNWIKSYDINHICVSSLLFSIVQIDSATGFWIEPHLLDPQSVFTWSKILMAVPQRSGLESCGHKVTVGKTILSIGKVSTTDFMGFSIQPASANFWF